MDSQVKHSRFKIDLRTENESIHKLGVPDDRSVFHVVDIARSELSRVPAGTHAVIRGLTGKEVVIYKGEGWLKTKVKALRII